MYSNRNGLFKSIIKSSLRHNPATLLLIIGIAVFIILPSILLNSSKSLLSFVTESLAGVYGKYDYIYYAAMDSDDNLDGMITGRMDIVRQLAADDDPINIGYADDNAIRLSGIKLLTGHMPTAEGEIAVTQSAQPYVEMLEEVLGYDLSVTGVVEDYGRLWPKGHEERELGLDKIDVFLSSKDSEKLSTEGGLDYLIVLIETGDEIDISDIDGMYVNANWRNVQLQDSYFDTPESFMLISCVVCIFLLIGIMLFCSRSVIRRYRNIWMLGADWKRLRKYYNIELCILLIAGNILGLLIGTLGSFAVNKVLENKLEMEIQLSIDMLNIMTIIFADICVVLVIGNLLFKFKTRDRFLKCVSGKTRKTGFLRLSFLEFRPSVKIFVFIIVIMFLSELFMVYINKYTDDFSQKTAYSGGYDGEMPMDYDFELLAENKVAESMEEDDICYISTYEKNGIQSEDLDAFTDLSGVDHVNAYKVTDKMLILKSSSDFDTYLDISDTYLDGQYSVNSLAREHYMPGHDELFRLIGYQENTVIQTVITGYPVDELESLNKYVTDGNLDMDKISSGEEVVLLVPAYEYSEHGSGDKISREMNFIDYTSESAINDSLFHVGDEITLSEYKVQGNFNSGINENEVDDIIERNDFKVKIGAIIRCYAGWFDRADDIQITVPTYRILTTDAAFDLFGKGKSLCRNGCRY